MKVLCLHGRGSNNEIFQTQTSSLRSNLDDFTFDFVQGSEPHTEGNCPANEGGEPLFRFAVFINGGTPLKVFAVAEEEIVEGTAASGDLERELQATFLRPSNLRARKGDNRAEAEAAVAARKRQIEAASTGILVDERSFLTDGELGVTRFDGRLDGTLIDVPTLHVICPDEENLDLGKHLLELCDPALAREHHRCFGHDFPRGQAEMRKIAEEIADLAASA
ncbi:hypothetical protein NKR19_g8908 [Coniochaeta hoffmannii]|uniref:Serine hydrolase domain-containing protein n=1 Tax=Coniochaeta hoffmannii TaxID=91930 RepID=A0AA38RJX6_9PEZI|nr:hypothetical protein NKR19_g8908 [Coniochaeta hoffmannii]